MELSEPLTALMTPFSETLGSLGTLDRLLDQRFDHWEPCPAGTFPPSYNEFNSAYAGSRQTYEFTPSNE